MSSRLNAGAALFLIICGGLKAQTTTWIGGNGVWSFPLNWSLLAPLPLDTVVFDSSVTTTVDAAYTFTNLEFTGGAVTLNSSSGSLSASNGIFYAGGGPVAINVPIIGTGNFWLNGGTGTVTLTTPTPGANTYSGTTEIFEGATLADGATDSFSANSVLYPGGTGGGTVQVNFNETVAGINDGGANGLITIASGMTLTLSGNGTSTYSGVIAGAGNLTKNGSSTQILDGANTYTGTTTVGTGADLQLGSVAAVGSLASSSIQGSGGFSFGSSNSESYSGVISLGMSVAQNGSGSATLTGANSYTGTTTVNNAGTLAAGVADSGVNGPFGGSFGMSAVAVNDGSLTLTYSTGNTNIGTLAGTTSGTVDIINSGATLTMANISGSTAFAGTIIGSGGIVTDQYQLTFSGANTYAGGTTINGSGSNLIANNAAGYATGTGPITIGAGASLLLGQSNGKGFIDPASAITNNGTIDFFEGAGTYPIANNIGGTGEIAVIVSTGTVILSGSNNYTGGTEVFSGTLQAGGVNAVGFLSALTFPNDGVFDLNGFNQTVGSIQGTASSGGIILTGGAVLTINDSITSPEFQPLISGTGTLVLGGSSSGLILLGANTYSGGTAINSGTLLLANPTGSGTGTGQIAIAPGAMLQIGAGVAAGAVDPTALITDDGSFHYNRSDTTTLPNTIIGTGGFELFNGQLFLTASNTYQSTTEVAGGTLIADNASGYATGTGPILVDASGTLSVGNADANGYLDPASPITDNGSLSINRTDTVTFPNSITGTGGLQVVGGGTLTLSSTGNNYSGSTQVINYSTLSDAGPNNFSFASPIQLTFGNLNANFSEVIGSLADGTASTVTVASGATLQSEGLNYVSDFHGAIGGNGAFAVIGGVQGLSGDNTYAGGTSVAGIGELFVGSDTAIGTGTLTFTGTAPELSPDDDVTLSNNIVLNAPMDNSDGGLNSLTLTGQISGPAGITWNAPGTLTLTGANTFMGTVDMQQGTLVVGNNTAAGIGNTIILAGSTNSGLNVESGVTINNTLAPGGSGNVISGNGTISSPALTVDATLVIAPTTSPGGGPGNLTFTNSLTFATGGAINFDLYDATGMSGTGFSVITANGGLNFTATPGSIAFNIISTDASGNPMPAINFNLNSPYTWTFATAPSISGFNPNQFGFNTSQFENSIAAGYFTVSQSGNILDLNFTPVPEPQEWMMMSLGSGTLAALAYRRRRRAAGAS